MNFKRDLYVKLQQDMLRSTEEDPTLFILLEKVFQTKFFSLSGFPSQSNVDLESFGRRNLWHGVFFTSFSDQIFNKRREEVWISKYSSLCVLELHQMWIERCSICHESTSSRIRIEDHETLQQKIQSVYLIQMEYFHKNQKHTVEVDNMSSDLLRVFLHESYEHAQD